MRLLLDTHALIWALDDPARIRTETRAAIEDPRNELFVSSITTWEIALKSRLRKLPLGPDLVDELERLNAHELRVSWAHGLEAGALPLHHRDPFDRLLIGQARVEGLTIVTRDPAFEDYQVATLPA